MYCSAVLVEEYWLNNGGLFLFYKDQIDLYKFLNDPEVSDNVFLTDNDIVFVPTSGRIVTINGAVARPFRYELMEEEK